MEVIMYEGPGQVRELERQGCTVHPLTIFGQLVKLMVVRPMAMEVKDVD